MCRLLDYDNQALAADEESMDSLDDERQDDFEYQFQLCNQFFIIIKIADICILYQVTQTTTPQPQCHPFSNSIDTYHLKNYYKPQSPKLILTNSSGSWPIRGAIKRGDKITQGTISAMLSHIFPGLGYVPSQKSLWILVSLDDTEDQKMGLRLMA